MPRWLGHRGRGAGLAQGLTQTELFKSQRPDPGLSRELSLRAHRGRANPKEAGPTGEGLSKPVDVSGTYGSSENKSQAPRNGVSKAAVSGVVGRKQRPKIKPKLVRPESTQSTQGTRRRGSLLLPLVSCNLMQ